MITIRESNDESAFISNKEKSMILDIFDKWDVVILKDYMKDEMFEGNLYHNFVVETDEMSETVLGDLERDLYALEELKDIGYEKNHNKNGVNARTFYFFKFIDSTDDVNEGLVIREETTRPYMYFTKHGIGPGTLPKDVKVIDWFDVNDYITVIYTDRFLTTNELNTYDIYPETMNSKLLDKYDLEVDESGKVYKR